MPRTAKPLSAVAVAALRPPANGGRRVPVGGVSGLLLSLRHTGSRSWILRTLVNGKRRDIGLGSYPEVSLAEARERAKEMKGEVWRGEDPVKARKARVAAEAGRITFAEAVKAYLDFKLDELSNSKHRQQWENTLGTYAIPVIGDLPVAEIEIADILRVLSPIWKTKTETASRLRGRIESVLAWATVNGHRTGDNPARWRGNLDATLPKPSKVAKVKHHPAVKVAEVSEFWQVLSDRNGTAAEALRFQTLTAARAGEIRGAKWSEIDLEAARWTIPAERMKASREHVVPLTGDALALLKRLPRRGEYVFPGQRSAMLSENTLAKVLKVVHAARGGQGFTDPKSGAPAVPHGLRSTFRDWCAEQGVERDLAEISLAHTVGSDVERAYRRTNMLDRRRRLMEAWAWFLRGEKGENVVQITAKR